MSLRELIKYITYRMPFANRLMSPKYPFKINPGQLTALINLINESRAAGGAVVEIGVGQGDTSVFVLEHLNTTGDSRPSLLFDTFSGFTDDSIKVEVTQRGKDIGDYDKFRYGDEKLFQRKLRRCGYENFKTFKGDAAAFDWSSIGPIGAVLLDIDLYAPTKTVLAEIFPLLCEGGGIVLDDCLGNTPWDGSLQAYEEFIAAHGMPFERVGEKGAVIRKPAG
jgi:O-methyltransferase